MERMSLVSDWAEMYIVARDWDSDLQMDQRVRSKKSGPSTQEMTMFVAVSHGYHIEGGQ